MITQLLTLDNLTYRQMPGLSGSELKHLAISPAHLWAARRAPRTESVAMRLGTMCHSMALEGAEVFTATYTEAKQCAAEFKSGPRKGQLCGKFGCGTHGDGISGNEYTPEELAQICHVSEAIRSHPHAKKLLAVGKPEVCMVGHNRKGRLDWLHPHYITDLKTTGKNVSEWEPGIGELLQAGAYLNLAEDCPEVGPRCFAWVIAEQDAPYAVRVIVLSPDDQASAQAAARRLQALYDECITAESWPSLEVPENPEFAEIKPWLKTQLQVIR